MKHACAAAMLAACLLIPFWAPAAPTPPVEVSGLALEGEIDGENIAFTLTLKADVNERGARLPLVAGDVAYLDGKLPRRSELIREKDAFALRFRSTGGEAIAFRFASRAVKDGDWRHTSFAIPVASIRKISVVCDRDDLEIRFPGALDVQRAAIKDAQEKPNDGKTHKWKSRVTAFLGVANTFEVRWKPEVRKLDADLVATCDANTIATASVGALRLDTIFTYRVIQGTLSKLAFQLPDVNVTQVCGEDIQDWRIDKDSGKLLVTLGRPKEDVYRLQVESEMVLPKFPSKFNLPVLSPEKVLRTSGFLLLGTDSAIKLQVNKAAGLTQVDQSSFPNAFLSPPARAAEGAAPRARSRPARSNYAYQYANTPYTLDVAADDIVTSFSAEDFLVLSLSDNDLSFRAAVQVDVKDAPAREIRIETDADAAWTVTSIAGRNVSEADTDVREKDGKRILYVPFRSAVMGMAMIEVQMEKTLKPDAGVFQAPRFRVLDAKSERGYLTIAGEKGIRLKAEKSAELREVHTSSTPRAVPNAQQAFRFKDPGWTLALSAERAAPSIHSEAFHLVSLGEGVLYGSAAITYHIGGAPVQEFKLRVPKEIEAVEFTGSDIEGWTRDGEVCTVRLQAKIMGDYTLLVTFDKQYDPDRAEIAVAGVETRGTESEVGYVAVASSASLKLTEAQPLPPTLQRIHREEIPAEYASPVQDPIIGAYRFVRAPHTALIRVEPYPTEQLLDQIAECIRMDSTLSRDGESVTTATYFIKNASRQYLDVALPPGAELWAIKVVDPTTGRKQDVLSQKAGGKYLIPVARPRDPNTTALQVEVTYAQSHGKLGFWSSGLRGVSIAGPSMPNTHATFAGWTVTVPEGFSIAAVRGNLTSAREREAGGLAAVGTKLWRIFTAPFRGDYTIASALLEGWGGNRSQELRRTVNLSSDAPAHLRLVVVPNWMGPVSSARGLLVEGLLGLGLVAVGVRRKGAAFWPALGLTLLAVAVAESALGRIGLTLAAAAAVLYLVLFKLGPTLFRLRGRRDGTPPPAGTQHPGGHPPPLPPSPPPSDPPPPFEPGEAAAGTAGRCSVGLLALVAAAGVAASGALAEKPLAASTTPVMDRVDLAIEGPGTGRDEERSAAVTETVEFRAETPVSFVVLPSTSVLKSYELGSRDLEITSLREGYALTVKNDGEYKVVLHYQSPVEEKDGQWGLAVYVPENMRNRVTLKLPEAGMDIQSDEAVLFRTADADKATTAEAVFGPTRIATFQWKPRIRKTRLEETVFFCEVNTHLALQAGVVDLTHLVRYQIAQGELKDLKIRVPPEMSVTAVQAPSLATWSFDPQTRVLDAILEKAVTGEFELLIKTQVSREGLPYRVTVGALEVAAAARQRGSIALAAPDTIQVRVSETKGVNPMNIEDFSAAALARATEKLSMQNEATVVRRSFRYHRAEEVSVTVETERVLPEIRVSELASLTVSDERVLLTTKLGLTVAKSGIFSAELWLPEDFEVETLTGRDVSHWDEIGIAPAGAGAASPMRASRAERLRAAARAEEGPAAKAADGGEDGGGRGVIVRFSRQVTDQTEINLVVARTEKGVEEKIVVPRVRVKDVRKHTGRLTVAGEKGIRLMVASHTGVDLKKSSEEGIRQAGVLVFDLLRPHWAIELRTEVLAPVVKPEILQWVDLSEGVLQCKAYIRYKIENAGVKTFRLKSPAPGATLSVLGNGIARVHEVDKKEGIWQVDLHGKQESGYTLTVDYQVSYESTRQAVKILPLRTLGTEGQTGYLVVTGGGRVQVRDQGDLAGLKVEDPRNIPATFRAGDLSNAIKCYRTLRPDYELTLSVVRHESADVLPASIDRVNLTSVVSPSGKLLTRARLAVSVGDLRLLKVDLPEADDTLWSALVNGKEVSISRDGRFYCIPLEGQAGGSAADVEFLYAGTAPGRGLGGRETFKAPKFKDLPLQRIDWDMYVPPTMDYSWFGGSMEKVGEEPPRTFTVRSYLARNKAESEASFANAKSKLSAGAELAKAGKQKQAKLMLQQALNYSQGQEDLNEDARVQFRSLQRQQVKVGLVNRRYNLRASRNVADEQQAAQIQGFQHGEYTPDYVQRVERALSAKDNMALETVAERMIEQQAGAAGVVNAIRIIVPEDGKLLRFRRDLQIDPKADLTVTFHARTGALGRALSALWPALLVLVALWIALAARRPAVQRP